MKKISILAVPLFFINLFSMDSEKTHLLDKQSQEVVLFSNDNGQKKHVIEIKKACVMSRVIKTWIENARSPVMRVPFPEKILMSIVCLMKSGYQLYSAHNNMDQCALLLSQSKTCMNLDNDNRLLLCKAIIFLDMPLLFESLVVEMQNAHDENLRKEVATLFYKMYERSRSAKPNSKYWITDRSCISFLLLYAPKFMEDVYLQSSGYVQSCLDDDIRVYVASNIDMISDTWLNKCRGSEFYCMVIRSIVYAVNRCFDFDQNCFLLPSNDIKAVVKKNVTNTFNAQVAGTDTVKNIFRFLYYKRMGECLDDVDITTCQNALKQIDDHSLNIFDLLKKALISY